MYIKTKEHESKRKLERGKETMDAMGKNQNVSEYEQST